MYHQLSAIAFHIVTHIIFAARQVVIDVENHRRVVIHKHLDRLYAELLPAAMAKLQAERRVAGRNTLGKKLFMALCIVIGLKSNVYPFNYENVANICK